MAVNAPNGPVEAGIVLNTWQMATQAIRLQRGLERADAMSGVAIHTWLISTCLFAHMRPMRRESSLMPDV